MSRADNTYKTSVKLNVEEMSVDVGIVIRESGEVAAFESFKANDIHNSLKQQVSLYGYSKLLQDRASDVDIGPGKLEAMKAVAAQLNAGQWAKERKVGAIVVSPQVEALATLKQLTIPAAQAALKAYTKEVREQILSNADVVAKAKEITEARAATEVASLDDMVPEGVVLQETVSEQAAPAV